MNLFIRLKYLDPKESKKPEHFQKCSLLPTLWRKWFGKENLLIEGLEPKDRDFFAHQQKRSNLTLRRLRRPRVVKPEDLSPR